MSSCERRRLTTVEWQITKRLFPSETGADELSTEEGRALLREASDIGTDRVLLSGGDVTARTDLADLVRFGKSLGLAIDVLAPAAPDRLHEALPALVDAGLRGVGVALHGADAKSHNAVSGVPDSFAASIDLLQSAREAGLRIEVRTALLLGRLRGLHALAEVAASIGAARWTLMAPLSGAGASFGALTLERALTTLADLAALHRFEIAAIAAPQLVRVIRLRYGTDRDGPAARVRVERDGVDRLFIAAGGEVMPSPELPLTVGHMRRDALAGALESETIHDLGRTDHLAGKCGACSFGRLCGGSRARALAQTADLWAEDPSCAYVPKAADTAEKADED